jgi:DNA repair exonuclease SbcCD ATPase subunit
MKIGITGVKKFTAGDGKRIEMHDRRKNVGSNHDGIDLERTGLNYDLHSPQNENYEKAVYARIKELHSKQTVRKDANVMVQIILTPNHIIIENISCEQQGHMFQDIYNGLADRYRRENIISSVVHLDENTPHMHFNFVPVTEAGRVSATAVLTRQGERLQDFCERIENEYCCQIGVQKDQTHTQSLDEQSQTCNAGSEAAYEDLRAENEELKALCSKLEAINERLNDYSEEIDELVDEIEKEDRYLEDMNSDFENENKRLKAEIKELEAKISKQKSLKGSKGAVIGFGVGVMLFGAASVVKTWLQSRSRR